MEPTYAIVDLETTGTDTRSDKIIQFGCVLVKNREIIGRFATDINPVKQIPKNIERLTGLTNARVKKAPLFEDVAEMIQSYLAGTIFVAHNISFDYRFLDESLKHFGFSGLQNAGVDTVSLAQIFFPTQVSFRLGDLANAFDLTHDHPHQADSDALVTAKLLLKIQERILSLPAVTLRTITRFSDQLPFQTGDYIKLQLQTMAENTPTLPENLEIVDGLVLCKKELAEESSENNRSYPFKKKNKVKLFPEHFTFRKAQGRMMNLVYQFFNGEFSEKFYLLEAQSGLGKTFGYLFPLSFLATVKSPAVIATPTFVLQQQLLEDIAVINQNLPKKMIATVIKSAHNYLDLAKFSHSLNEEGTKQISFYKMLLLVWLTETTTGDFSELNLLRISDGYFKDIACSATHAKQKAANNPFAQVDFYYWVKKRAVQANILITNHAFLLQEEARETFELPKSSFLIIDEAHHLPDNLLAAASSTLALDNWLHNLEFCQGTLETEPSELTTAETYVAFEVIHAMHQSLTTLQNYYLKKYPLQYAQLYPYTVFENEPLPLLKLIDQIQLLIRDFTQLIGKLQEAKSSSYALKNVLSDLFEEMALFGQFYTADEQGDVLWFEKNRQGGLELHRCQTATLNVTDNQWVKRFDRILLTGATFSLGKKNYLAQSLQLEDAKKSRLRIDYDYENRLQFIIPADLTEDNRESELITQIRYYLKEIKKPLLVLFTSHDALKKVYYQIQETANSAGREVLAQGINGTKEKLLKRFSLSEDSIMLGSDTFWEGVDLPGKDLSTIFVAKLPFENPNRPLVQAQYKVVEAQKKNPFYDVAIPACSLRLNQAFGRLLRSTDDSGSLVLFDERFTQSSYAGILQKNLPENLRPQLVESAEVGPALQAFLSQEET